MSIFENFEKKLQAEPKSIVFTEGKMCIRDSAYPGAEDSHSPQLPVYAGALCERDRHHCGR